MAIILNIETSGEICSVGISDNDKVIITLQANEKNSHSIKLAPLTNELFKMLNLKPDQLNAVAISRGPGSYTGLRIGTSFAKGLCYSLNIPLLAIDTFKIMCIDVLQNYSLNNKSILCPMIDARRMEVYTALYDTSLNNISEIQSLVLNDQAFSQYDNNELYFFGSGMNKWKELTNGKKISNFKFIPDILPKAESMAPLSYRLFKEKIYEDIAYFEPFYLKDFIAGTSTKNKLF
ncbi:MAG: tRNA (adenosine(37)-N6)-threonylcarbamoyltransferase complex dimerization subunit type 1 TsaB [Bacteroidales bacterium]